MKAKRRACGSTFSRSDRTTAPFRAEPLERRTLLAAVAWDGNAGDGLWNSAANWSNDQLPAAQDDVTIAAAGTIRLDGANASVRSLTVESVGDPLLFQVSARLELASPSSFVPNATIELRAGGEISGAGDLLIASALHWTGGSMSGGGTTTVGFPGRAYIYGADPKQLRRELVIGRDLDADTAELTLENGSLRIGPTSTASFTDFTIVGVTSSSRVLNAGMTSTNGTVQVGAAFDNSGTVAVEGELSLSGGGSSDGSFTVEGASELNFGGPGYTFTAGTIDGGDVFFDAGQIDWLGGTMSGAGTTTNGAILRIAGTDPKRVERTLYNQFEGTIEWTGGGDIVFAGGEIAGQGPIKISGDGTMRAELSAGGSGGHFSSAGPIHQSGNTRIEVSCNLIDSAHTDVTGTLTLTGGGTARITFDVTGTLVLSGDSYFIPGTGEIVGTGTVRVEGGSHFFSNLQGTLPRRLQVVGSQAELQTYVLRVNELEISGGATLRTAAGLATARSLALDGASQFDISGSGFILDYDSAVASPLAEIRARLSSGYAGGSWNGTGIMSSALGDDRALGYAESAAIFSTFPAPVQHTTVDDTAIIILPTFYGDANLDGTVNLADFNRLAANFGATNAVWSQGDFNYDCIVNLADFNRLASNFGATTSVSIDIRDAEDEPDRIIETLEGTDHAPIGS